MAEEIENGGQPSDETPLRVPEDTQSDSLFDDLFTTAQLQLDMERADISDQLDVIISQANTELDDAQFELDKAFVDIIVDGRTAMDKANASVSRAFNQIHTYVDREVNEQIDKLLLAGVNVPVAHRQLVDDLANGDIATFQGYFPPGELGPVIPDPVAVDAERVVPFQPPPPRQDPLDPVLFPPVILPDDDTFFPHPPIPEENPDVPDTPNPPEDEPPADGEPPQGPRVPPPSTRPTVPLPPPPGYVPPAAPPPPPTQELVCTEPPADVCEIRTIPWLWSTRHYTMVRCVTGCPIEVRTCQAAKPPTVPDGFQLLPPSYRGYTDAEIYSWLAGAGCLTRPEDVPSVPPPPAEEEAPPEDEPPASPPPPPEEEPEDRAKPPWLVAWDAADACQQSERACDRIRDIERGEFEFVGPEADTIAGEVVSTLFSSIVSLANKAAQLVTASVQSNPGAASAHLVSTVLTSIAAHWFGMPTDYYQQWTTYTFQRCNPKYLPAQAEIDLMYLSHEMTTAEWKCYTQAHGNMEGHRERLIKVSWTQPTTLDSINMYRRGIIKDKQSLINLLKLNKWEKPDEMADKLLKLTEPIPQIDDVIRFLVRDVFDEELVGKYGYDTGFPNPKFNEGSAGRKMIEALGMPLDTVKYFWRAHWRIPSPTQLIDMMHRLREDRLLYGFTAPKRVDVTTDDVRAALLADDYAPGWVDAFMASSYHPITNSDATRMYYSGQFDKRHLIDAFRTNEYEKQVAEKLADFHETVRNRQLANSTGVWTARNTLKAFRNGEIKEQEARDFLKPIMPDASMIDRLIQGSLLQIKAETIRVCMKGLKRRFMLGEFGDLVAQGLILATGTDPARIPQILEAWTCERDNRRKEPRVNLLCEWYTNEIITPDGFYERLIRLGYSPDDSARIASTCHNREVVKRATKAAQQAEKTRREFLAEQRRQAKEFKAWTKEQEAEYERITKALEKRRAELEEARAVPPLPGGPPGPERNGVP